MKKFLNITKKTLAITIVLASSVNVMAKDIDFKKAAQKQEVINVPRRSADDVYKIYLSPLHQTVLTFGDEIVEYSETGDNISFFTIDDTNNVRLKATDEDLKTDLVVKTNNDLYYFKLTSTANNYNPMINFLYPQKEELKKQHRIKTTEKVSTANLKDLNFKYKISRKMSWTPTQIFDDGVKTYMYMPEKIQELPALMVKDDDGGLSLLTWRVKETEFGTRFFVIDRVFKDGILVLGKNKVLIKNKAYKF